MAKLEREFNCNFDELLQKIETGILNGNISATLEDSSDFVGENTKCSIRVFERFSGIGGNRVSLNVTLFQNEKGKISLSAITSGGSQAMLWKINTLGEKAFLNKLISILEK